MSPRISLDLAHEWLRSSPKQLCPKLAEVTGLGCNLLVSIETIAMRALQKGERKKGNGKEPCQTRFLPWSTFGLLRPIFRFEVLEALLFLAWPYLAAMKSGVAPWESALSLSAPDAKSPAPNLRPRKSGRDIFELCVGATSKIVKMGMSQSPNMGETFLLISLYTPKRSTLKQKKHTRSFEIPDRQEHQGWTSTVSAARKALDDSMLWNGPDTSG